MSVAFSGFAEWLDVRALSAIQARNEARIRRLEEERISRAPLLGPPIAGNAWDFYSPAVADLQAVIDSTFMSAVDSDPYVTAIQKDVAARSGAILERIRQGARRDRASSPIRDRESSRSLMGSVYRAVQTLAAEAALRREGGDLDGAIDDVAAGLQLPLDCGRPARSLYGDSYNCNGLLGWAAWAALDLIRDGRISRGQLERIDGLLSAAEAQIPEWTETLEASLARCLPEGIENARADGAGTSFPWIGRWGCEESLRHQFVTEEARERRGLMAALRAEENIRREGICVLDTWNERLNAQSAGWIEPDVLDAERSAYAFRGYLRLVRAAVHHKLGRGPADTRWPVDPSNNGPMLMQILGDGTVRIHTRPLTFKRRRNFPWSSEWMVNEELEVTLPR